MACLFDRKAFTDGRYDDDGCLRHTSSSADTAKIEINVKIQKSKIFKMKWSEDTLLCGPFHKLVVSNRGGFPGSAGRRATDEDR